MKRYGSHAGLGVGFLVLFAAVQAVAQQVDSDPFAQGIPSRAVTVTPSVVWTERPDPAPTQAIQPAKRGNPLWEIPITSLAATRDRPIFSPSRRLPPPVPVAVPYAPVRAPVRPASPQLTLLGTVLGAGDEEGSSPAIDGIGIFLDQTNNSVVRLKTGDYHNGWLLRSVQGREATLQNDRDTVVLALPARGTGQTSVSHTSANTSISAVQPVAASPGNPAPKFQLEKYD